MAALKLINLFALSSLAVLLCSFGATPTNALSLEVHNVVRHIHPAHDGLAKRSRPAKRAPTCKSKHPPTIPSPSVTKSKPPAPAKTPQRNSGGGSGNGGVGGKVGIAWPNSDSSTLHQFKTRRSSVIYTWSPWIPQGAKKLGFRPAVMLWGAKQIGDFTKLVKPGYANIALGYNEPNQRGQSDMSPQYGAQLWKQYLQPLSHQGYSLGSPAVTSAPSGITWMRDFFAACGGCTFNFVAVHWYGTESAEFISYIQKFHSAFGKPIWPTEYACQNFGGGAQCSRDQTFAFHRTVMKYMDGQSWVPHYFPFGFMHDMSNVNPDNQLMGSNGGPNALGNQYLY